MGQIQELVNTIEGLTTDLQLLRNPKFDVSDQTRGRSQQALWSWAAAPTCTDGGLLSTERSAPLVAAESAYELRKSDHRTPKPE